MWIFIKKNLFLFLIILSPGFWSAAKSPSELAKEWSLFPTYLASNVNSFFEEEKLNAIKQMRWANVDQGRTLQIVSKIYYNKVTILVEQVASYLAFFSPKIYFHSGSDDYFSPHTVEPIPLVFLPFFVMGFVLIIKKSKFKPVFLYLFFGAIAFAAGKNNFAYLLPVLIISLYFTSIGYSNIKEKYFRPIFILSIFYCLFVMGRFLFFLT